MCVILTISLLMTALPLFAGEKGVKETARPRCFKIEANSYRGSFLTTTRKLHHSDGTYVNFSATNHGKYPVRIAINNKVVTFIEPNKTSHVRMDIGFFGKTCTFTAAPQGGSLDIGYKIVQRP